MKKLTKIKLARILSKGTFWISIIVSYLTFRNIPTDQAYFLISLYSISVVLLEYPTGVIGDTFSHALSYKLGLLITALSYIGLSLPGTFITYAILMVIVALGISLISGSDEALLFNNSNSFEKDYSQVKTYSIIISVISISFGAWIYNYNKNLPTLLTGLFYFLAFLIILRVKEIKEKNIKSQGNVFAKAKQGLLSIKRNKILRGLVLYNALIAAYFLSFKWLYNELFLTLNFKESIFGIIISGLTLLTALGTKISKKFPNNIYLNFLIFIILLLLTGFTSSSLISLTSLLILFTDRGIIETKLQIEINNKVRNDLRASTISLRNLLKRLLSSLYLFILGLISNNLSLGLFIIYSGIIILFTGLIILITHLNNYSSSE